MGEPKAGESRTFVDLPADLKKTLQKQAIDQDTSLKELLARIIKDYLERRSEDA